MKEGRKDELLRLREEPCKTIVESYLTLFKHKNPFTSFEGISIIKIIQARLENEIRNQVQEKGIYYWFHLYRRFAPGSNFEDESISTISLYRQMSECAFLKYGRLEPGDELIYPSDTGTVNMSQIAGGLFKKALTEFGMPVAYEAAAPGICLGNFDFNSLLEFTQMERLIFEYWRTTACLRRLYKGGVLHIENDRYFVLNDSSTDKLMNVYDSRGGRLGDLTTTSGILINPADYPKYAVSLVPICNVQKLSEEKYPQGRLFGCTCASDFIPNFMWVPVDFDYYYRQHEFCEQRFRECFGFGLPCFVLTLFLICRQAIMNSLARQGKPGMGLIQRAYQHFTSRDQYVEELISLSQYKDMRLPSLDGYRLESGEVAHMLRELSLDDKNRGEINLTTRGPRPIIFPSRKGQFVLDYAAILPRLASQTHFIIGDLEGKGLLFEASVKQKAKNEGMSLWDIPKQLKHSDGTSRNVDLAFYLNNILFICELKSINKSFAFEIGNIQALNFRQTKLISALAEADDKARWLQTRRIGSNYKIPDSVDALVPLVVSLFVEYIWSTDNNLWLTENIPRVCLPSELEELVKDESLAEIIKKPFVVFVV
jgi:hypothetical protein